MAEILSKEHRILEKGLMEFRPFGIDFDGKRIRDATGVKIRAFVDYLEEAMVRSRGPTAGEQAVQELCQRLNERIRDSAYHVTPTFLKNVWNSYSYEFVCFLAEFCKDISGDPSFSARVGEEKFISAIIQTLGRPFTVKQIYQRFPHFGEKFSSLHLGVVEVTDRTAILTMQYPESISRQFGPYRRACAELVCQAAKGGLMAVPQKIHHLKPAIIRDRLCVADGDDRCEWEVAWEPEERGRIPFTTIGVLVSIAVYAYLFLWHPDLAVPEALLLALPPAIIFWMAHQWWSLEKRVRAREKLIQEQLRFVEARHEELRTAYLEQEQIAVQLREKVNQLTTLHSAGLVFNSTLDRETIIDSALQALVKNLLYDLAIICSYDPMRRIANQCRSAGASRHVAEFVSTLELPVSVPEGIEALVLEKGIPVLISDVEQELHRLHPHMQHFARLTNVKSFITVPLKVKDRVLGAITVSRYQESGLNSDDLNLVVTFANQMAIALNNVDAYRQIEDLNIGLEAKVRERTLELERADRLRSLFLSHVSHELRTPLTSIQGFVENLLSGLAGPLTEKQQTTLHRVGVNADRLIRMIADLLDRTRIEAGKMELSPTLVDLCKCAADAVEQVRSLALGKRQALQFLESEGRLFVWADGDRLIQIFTNLIENAIKFTPEGGRIIVQVGLEDPAHVRAIVKDTGPGIPPEAIPKVFDPFFRASQDRRASPKGLGLGLSIVKHLVELHGGTISLRSEIGQGSEFLVTLPAWHPVDELRELEGGSSKRILVVDDDPDIRQLLFDRLGSYGYEIETAQDGSTALEMIRKSQFDGMILDIGMPELNGIEVLRQVRAGNKTIPIVMVTASGSKERATQAVNAGAQAYLLKPFTAEHLKEIVERWFGPTEARRS